MRILQITTEMRPAGAERIVLELSRGLQETGHEVLVVSLLPLPPSSFIVDDLAAAGIAVRSLDLTRWTPWRAAQLQRILDAFRPQLVHAHLFHPHLLTRFLVDRKSSPLVNTVHIAERRPSRWWQMLLDRWTAGRCDSITAVSMAVREFHAAGLGVPPESIPVIMNGSRPLPPLSSGEVRSLRTEWGVSDCRRVLGSVGRLNFQKGYDRLLRVLPLLEPAIPEGETWGVVLVGDGPEAGRLEEQARGLSPRIRFRLAGFRSDAARCAGAFDLFVMPSRFEGFGLTLTEAMSQGVPAVVSPADSLPEVIRGYPGGSVLDFDLPAGEVAAVLSRLLREPPARVPMVPFTVEEMVDGYLGLYRRLLTRPGTA